MHFFSMLERVIMHVDMDAFYAAIEQRDNPEYRGKPVAVRLGESSVIAAASYEAKKLGVKSAMSVLDASGRCPEIILVSADLWKYAHESDEFQRICTAYSREFEPYSVSGIPEEGWLDFTGKIEVWDEAEAVARALKTDIWNRTGLTASAGVAYARIPAKMASDYKKPDGLTVVRDTEEFAALFQDSGVRDLFGVGEATERKLRKLGIETIGDIAGQEYDFLIEHFKPSRGTYLYYISRGIDETPVVPWYRNQHKPKSAGNSMTVYRNGTRNFGRLCDKLRLLSEQLGWRLRGSRQHFRAVSLEVEGYDRTGNKTRFSRSRSFDYDSERWRDIYDAAASMLYNELDRGVRVVKVGVRASRLTSEPQLTLFRPDDYRVF